MHDSNFALLAGQTLTRIHIPEDKETVEIETAEGRKFRLYHSQDCCESVKVDSVSGDLSKLIGEPLTEAVETIHERDKLPEDEARKEYMDSFTFTDFTLATSSGKVRIRWYGESNGYYSESVSFISV